MTHKLILFIKNLFGLNTNNDNEEPLKEKNLFNTSSNNQFEYSSSKSSSFNLKLNTNIAPTTIDSALASQQVNSGVEHQKVIKYIEKNQKKLKYNEVINVINVNIYYLEQLNKALEKTVFIDEQSKVNGLLEQSKNCLKLLQHINTSKIFYENTINFIISHAIQVGALTEHLKDIDIANLINE